MSEHYTKATLETTAWCRHCNRLTQHAVSAGRIGHCLEHGAQQLTKKQITARERRKQRELFT